jgi:uncharacterized protein
MTKKIKILAAGDIHGDESIAKNLAIKGERNKVDLVVLAGDITNPLKKKKVMGHFKDRGLEAVFVPGNWDFNEDINFIKKTYGSINLDEGCLTLGNINFFGLGSANFELENNRKKDFNRVQKLFNKMKKEDTKNVFVSHLHAAGTKAEFSGFKGSYVLRKVIEDLKPNVVISAHIHEAEGIEEQIKNTKIFQVGPRGKIIYL